MWPALLGVLLDEAERRRDGRRRRGRPSSGAPSRPGRLEELLGAAAPTGRGELVIRGDYTGTVG